MKKTTILLVLAVILTSVYLFADELSLRIQDNIFRIEVGEQHKKATTILDLQDRIWRLEKAVYQLQNKVFDLQVERQIGRFEGPKTYSCYLSGSFGQTFTGKGKTKAEAQGKALKECSEKSDMKLDCKESKLKCDD